MIAEDDDGREWAVTYQPNWYRIARDTQRVSDAVYAERMEIVGRVLRKES
jgi:hypothetical protein